MEYALHLTAERLVVRESVKGIVWAIFFHRLFGPIVPTTAEFLLLTYPMAANMLDLDSLIDEKINLLIKNRLDSNQHHVGSPLESQDSSKITSGHLAVQFYDHELKKKSSGWFSQGKHNDDALRLWELWVIDVKCLPLDEAEENIKVSVASFDENLARVADIADSHKDHIPPITSLDTSPFPYDIKVESPGTKEQGWGEYLKLMWTEPPDSL